MNNNIRLSVLILTAAFLSGCSDVLDQTPKDRINLETYFENREDAEAALIGAYDAVFRDIVPASILNTSFSARELEHIGDVKSRPVQYRPVLRPDNDGGVGTIWVNSYRSLARINLLLDKLPQIPEPFFVEDRVPTTRNRKAEIEGEAKALRAYVYTNLALNWGDVPIILKYPTSASPTANHVARSPEADVWKQVIADLTFAEANLPENHNFIRANQASATQRLQSKARFTKGMAKLMLARIAMWNKDWNKAASLCDDVMKNGQFTLNANYTTTFVNIPAGAQNASESILEVQSVNQGFISGGVFTWEFYTTGRTQLPPGLISNYEGTYLAPLDVRFLQAINPSFNTNGSLRGYTMLKYYNLDSPYASADPYNYVLGRLGEVHLLRAESLNEISFPNTEALTLINGLRTRALNTTYSKNVRREGKPDTIVFARGVPQISFDGRAGTIHIKTQAEFRDFIRKENWREMAFEGQQWFNLRRWDIQDGTKNALKSVYLDLTETGSNPGKIHWPISLTELRNNPKLTQTKGYE
jgi:starch-binding outer membrane protein, SusD/RagB family